MYNRYIGNSGRVIRVREPAPKARPTPQRSPAPPAPAPPPSSSRDPLAGLRDGLGGLFGKLRLPEKLETEDLLIALVLYLLYRESGDIELLVILGAMFLL